MKTEEIFDMLTGIDEKLISSVGEDLENYRYSAGKAYSVDEKSGFSWKRASAAIVGAAAVMLGAFFVVKNIDRTKIPIDDPSSDYSSDADSGSSSSTENSSSSSSSSSESSSSSSVESSSSSSVESSSSDNPSGESNPSVTQDISAISSNDPQIGFWVALYAKENAVKAGSPFSAEISFGSSARNLERITVTISSEDFEISKSCPDEYVVDGQKYSNDDFYVAPSSKISPDDLPAHFTITLSPKSEKEIFSGSTDIVLTEYMVGGYSIGTVTLYYYGDSDLICLSTISQKDAESIYIAEGGEMWQPPASQGYYDSVFKEIAIEPPTLWGPPPTFDEVIDEADDPKYGRLDSFYLVEAVEIMIKSESGELIGFEDWFYGKYGVKYDEVRDKPEVQGADYFGNSVIYRVKVIEDLITGEKCGYDIYTDVYMNGPISQSPGDPPYAPGERFTLLLRNKAEGSEIRDTAEESIFRLDVKEINGEQVAFARRKCCGMSYFIAMNFEGSEKISETVVTSTTDNPVTYNTKIKLLDFCGFLRKEWQNRGVGSGEYTGYEKYIQQIAEEYKTAGINLSDEQIKKLNDLYVSQKVNPGWERLPYQEGIITGEVDPNAPRLDLETAKRIISEHTDFNEIIAEFKKVQQPNFIGGSGHIVIIYKMDDSGSEITFDLFEKQIHYLKVDPDGTRQTEILFGSRSTPS